MGEKNAPATIWACMEGPMVGLFVSGGYTAGWPKYTRADSHDKLVDALKAAKVAIEMMERPFGIGPEVAAALDARCAKIDAALASLQTQEGQR